jgi:2-oxoacid:acceptor oxidoreductase delta subunit (pyruvate/2-ketoisovalerate family)
MPTKNKKNEVILIRCVDDMPEMPASLGSMRWNKTASWRSIKPIILEEKCKRCMICWKVCPEPAIFPTDPPAIDYQYCKGCGICIEECPFNAIVSEKEGK